MTFTVGSIIVLLLLLPGVGFIVGVNFADKNVREIVFRNTPAEIGYVLTVSLAVHLLFGIVFHHFNAASLALNYAKSVDLPDQVKTMTEDGARGLMDFGLLYFSATAFLGWVAGLILGNLVRYQKITFFAKHPWMLDLVGVRAGDPVYAHVLLSPTFSKENSKGTGVISVEGFVSDPYFDANGTLLYLVFTRFRETSQSLECPPFLGKQANEWDDDTKDNLSDHLVIEGRWITMARYQRLKAQGVRKPDALAELRDAVAADEA